MPEKDLAISAKWYVPTLTHENLPDNIPPITVNNPANYAYQNITPGELAKRQQYSKLMTGSKIYNFSPERLILHESIAQISLNYITLNEENFRTACNNLIDSSKKLANSDKYQDAFKRKELETQAETQRLISKFQTTEDDNEVAFLKTWQSKLDGNLSNQQKLTILTECLYDKILLEKNEATIKEIITDRLSNDELIQQMPTDKLTKHDQTTRKSILVVGGAASGKGSITELNKKFILNEDVAELNPDLYKKIILPDHAVDNSYDKNNTKIFHGSLTHEESALIFDKIAFKWASMAQEGQAPNLLLDICRASDWAINIASSGGTEVEIHAASLNTKTALERSYKRGEETGRYMPTNGLLQGHKDQLATQSNAINNKRCNLVLYDTETVYKQPPELILVADEQKNEIHILNNKKALNFFMKGNLNTLANNDQTLYSDNSAKSIVTNLQNYAGKFSINLYASIDGKNEEKNIATLSEGVLKINNLKLDEFINILDKDKALKKIFQGIEENNCKIICDNKDIEQFLEAKHTTINLSNESLSTNINNKSLNKNITNKRSI